MVSQRCALRNESLGTKHGVEARMKHTKTITKAPTVAQAQVSNKQAFTDFLVALTDQAVEFVFQKTD